LALPVLLCYTVSMEIRQLRYLIGLAEEKNYLNAADEMYVSQSQLSKKIMQMEDELGVQLIDRSRRSISITPAGELTVQYARQIMALYDSLSRELDAMKTQTENTLTIAAIPVLAPYRIPALLAAFAKTAPQVKVLLREIEAKNIFSELAAGGAELGLCRDIYTNPTLYEFIPICSDEIAVIVSASSALAGKKNIDIRSLQGQSFILLDEQTMLKQFEIDICAKAGFSPDVVYTSKHPDDIVEMVAAGKGISFMMRRVFSYINKDSIAAVPLAEPVTSRLGIVWPRRAKLSRRAELFAAFVRKNGSGGLC